MYVLMKHAETVAEQALLYPFILLHNVAIIRTGHGAVVGSSVIKFYLRVVRFPLVVT
jgi:hypothetical protein